MNLNVMTLKQPFASLIILGAKQYETRGWNTSYRGRVLIHAGLDKEYSAQCAAPPFDKYIKGIYGFYALPFGAIIGECMIEYTQETEGMRDKISLEERAFGDYRTGRWAWRLRNPVAYKVATPARGQLQIWTFPQANLLHLK